MGKKKKRMASRMWDEELMQHGSSNRGAWWNEPPHFEPAQGPFAPPHGFPRRGFPFAPDDTMPLPYFPQHLMGSEPRFFQTLGNPFFEDMASPPRIRVPEFFNAHRGVHPPSFNPHPPPFVHYRPDFAGPSSFISHEQVSPSSISARLGINIPFRDPAHIDAHSPRMYSIDTRQGFESQLPNATHKDRHTPLEGFAPALHTPIRGALDRITHTLQRSTPTCLTEQTDVEVTLPETNKTESHIPHASIQPLQQKSADTPQSIQVQKVSMKRKRSPPLHLCSTAATEECIQEHASDQPLEQKSVGDPKCVELDIVQDKGKKLDRKAKKAALSPINNNEDTRLQSQLMQEVPSVQVQLSTSEGLFMEAGEVQEQALPHINHEEGAKTQSGPLQEVASFQVQLPILEEVIARVEEVQKLTLPPPISNMEYNQPLSGPPQDILYAQVQPPVPDETIASVVKQRKRGSNNRAKNPALAPINKKEDIKPHCGLSDEVVTAQVKYPTSEEMIAKVEKAAIKAHSKVLAQGNAVTVVKVVQEMLRNLNYASLESVGLCLYDVPHLRKLVYLEGKVNTLIMCHMTVRKITTLYDLSQEILSAEGVQNFNELRIGPLSLHPLVVQYFAPPMGSKVCKITAADVLNYLSNYLDKHAGNIQVGEFVSYMTKARALCSSAHLCVQIRSLGMYTSCLRREKKADVKMASRRSAAPACEEIPACKGQNFNVTTGSVVKKAQQESTAKQVDSFLTKVTECPKHMVYLSSEEEDCKERKSRKLATKKKDALTSDQPPSKSCPYPSAAEERLRFLAKVTSKVDKELGEYALPIKEIREFITTWRDICCSHSVEEVLTQIINANGSGLEKNRNKKKLLRRFTSYPARAILNVAVLSMKAQLWSSFLDERLHNEINETRTVKRARKSDRTMALEISADQNTVEELSLTCKSREQLARSSEQVLQVVVCVLREALTNSGTVLNICRQGDQQSFWLMIKRIMTCEKEVINRLSIKRFSKLKLGFFPEFIELHWDKILEACLEIYRSMARRIMSVNGVSEERAQSFLSQVNMAVGDGERLSCSFAMQLFAKQFSLQNVDDIFQDLFECAKCDNTQNYAFFFSSALLATKGNCTEGSNVEEAKNKEMVEVVSMPQIGFLGNISSTDAKHCLLKAPMLCSLGKWSQWDSVFSPTLGSFPSWLEKEGPIEGLVCLATSDGNYYRIDGSATVDTFLAAAVKGCGKAAALQIVSILASYGGVDRVPHALLKSYSHQALEILVGKSQTVGKVKRKLSVFEKKWLIKRAKHHAVENTVLFSSMRSDPFQEYSGEDFIENYMGAVQFVFDMLTCVPSEFVVFAASIVIPALSKIVPGVTTAMLHLYPTVDLLMRLHEIGLSLGIIEWVMNFQSLFLPFEKTNLEICKTDASCYNLSHSKVLHEYNEENIRQVIGDKASPSNKILVNMECNNDSATTDGASGSQDHAVYEKEATELIAMIRKEEFGMDMDLPSKESDLLAKQHARIGRALQCLSQELYSQDTHFVLELVQNADDNQYADGVEASIAFILESKRVVVVNNELGFTSSHMRALCDVGSSTKSGAAAGYIGHKGIGFKSVFCVTDAPEVHSRGFHVKFDISGGKIGFLLPTVIPPTITNWESIEKVLSGTKAFTEQMRSAWNTCMILPLKSSILDGAYAQMLSTKLDDIQPSLLLFLHRLQKIIIKNDLTGTLRVLQRCHLHDGLVRVSDGMQCATWLVVKQQFDAIVERPGVKMTELALALPLQEVLSGVYEACNEHQQVFAFLPLRSYGLRFIIQGDFILPSSREELDADSAWNQWLFSEVPSVFVKAVEAFKELACFKQNPGRAASIFLSFIPLEGEVQGFFASLPRMILARLRASQCLPVEGSEGEWAPPCVLLGGWSDSSRTLLSDQQLREHLGLYFLHRDVVISPSIASVLGVHMYGFRVLMSFMESLCLKKGALQALGPRWISAWFLALHKCICEAGKATSLFQPRFELEDTEKLKQFSCIPLSNGIYTSLVDGPVWLPCIDAGTVDDATSLLKDFPLLYSEMRTVHSLLLEPLNLEVNQSTPSVVELGENKSLIFSMLQRLGVGQIFGHEVMTKHILPSMASDDFLKKPKPLVVQYLGFVMVHLQLNCKHCKADRSSIMSQLQKNAVIATKGGQKRVNTEPLHFGLEFDCKIDVKKILEGLQVGWTEIDPAYLEVLQGSPERASLYQWRQFFKDLGVTDFVKVECGVKKLHDKSNNISREVVLEHVEGEDDRLVQDWECPELVQILESLCNSDLDCPNKLNRLSHLITTFDLLWDECYSKYSASDWSPGREKKKSRKKTSASFVVSMRSFSWVQSSFDRKLYQPTQLYYRCSAVESILGMHAPYSMPQINSLKFAEALGLKVDVSASDVLDLLRIWNQYPLKTSVSQMARLYSFVWNETAQQKEAIANFFENEACIFVPAKMKAKPDVRSKGRFYSSNLLFWEDGTGSFAKLIQTKDASIDVSSLRICPKALNILYPTLRGFLVDLCNVQAAPRFDDYFSVLKLLADNFLPQEVLAEALAVLTKWSNDIHTSQFSEICKWKEVLQGKQSRILPTVQNQWVSLDHDGGLVCWCDDEVLGQQFLGFNNVFYVCVNTASSGKSDGKDASTQTGKLVSFLQAMGISALSKVVKRQPITCGARRSKQIFDIISWSLAYTQRYLQKWHGDIYNDLQQSAFDIRLKKIQCVHADRLFFCYKLPGELGSGRKQFETDYLLQGDTFYATNLKNLNSLYLEFSRLYFDGTPNLQLANFLHLITLSFQSGSQESELEALLASQGIGSCSEVEKKWLLDCPSVDESQTELEPQKHSAEQCNGRDEVLQQPVNDANSALPIGCSRPIRKNLGYKYQGSAVDRVAACQRSLAAVMNQIEAKKSYKKSKGKQSGSKVRDTTPIFESKNLIVTGDLGCKNKDAPAMVKEGMASLEGKCMAIDAASCRPGNSTAISSVNTVYMDDKVRGVNVIENPPGDSALPHNRVQGQHAVSSLVPVPEGTWSADFLNREKTCFGNPSEQQVVLTGRLGEAVVFNHLMEKYGPTHVNWMNAETERGLPYDIVVDGLHGQKLLVEVKATWSEYKDWFEISNREWEFAAQAGERFVIIRAFLGGLSGSPRLVWLPNPLKLCQERRIKLAVIVPQQQPADFNRPGKFQPVL